MDFKEKLMCASAIVNKAKELGASLVGICSVEELKKAPSFTLAPKIPKGDVGSVESDRGLGPGEVCWPEDAKSVIVIAYAHPESEPRLDWWYGDENPPGNKVLIKINKDLSQWIESQYEIKTYSLHYFIEKGGIFLKDAAAQSGLGCIGKNNMLITPEYGPRVRLRAMLVTETLPVTGTRKFNPCELCQAPCLNVCQKEAFSEIIYSKDEMGQSLLPGLIGNYSRPKCNIQMVEDEKAAVMEPVPGVSKEPIKITKYCRSCELSCPVGRE
ncbi:hypothetical protein [Candidatus Contubernalis alkaliaceticus]|uniref:hypothetical protein n=1 Tax=Candidatus Contubernalis alkaliaceticus TaxID=338645 RepID=UPI001F4C27D8|nr:hypothetical protein [Candidatus Contubernalis alkalaceticus]UNC92207.1 epoxyqueuosine reductase [Candidatus Contubernalis alkalaceticus]